MRRAFEGYTCRMATIYTSILLGLEEYQKQNQGSHSDPMVARFIERAIFDYIDIQFKECIKEYDEPTLVLMMVWMNLTKKI